MVERSTDEEGVILAVSRVGGALLRVGDRYLVGWFSDAGVMPPRGLAVVGPLEGVGPRSVALGPEARSVTLVVDQNDLTRAEADQITWV